MRPEPPERRPRRNTEIRAAKVRLIGEAGDQIGIVVLREALDAAYEAGLDLIEVAPESDPPVCRIMDWGRFRYEQKQKERDQRRKQKSLEVKGLRLRPTTGEGDFQVTRSKAERFLRDGHKVRVEVRFRGREITHRELGEAILMKLVNALEGICEVEQHAAMEGRRMFMLIAPRPEIVGTTISAEDEALLAAAALANPNDEDDDDDDATAAEQPEAAPEAAAQAAPEPAAEAGPDPSEPAAEAGPDPSEPAAEA